MCGNGNRPSLTQSCDSTAATLASCMAGSGITNFLGGFLSALGVVGGSLAHVNPTFVFGELVVTNYCGNAHEFGQAVLRSLAQQGYAQGYKVCIYAYVCVYAYVCMCVLILRCSMGF
jgi:hypothetical protein